MRSMMRWLMLLLVVGCASRAAAPPPVAAAPSAGEDPEAYAKVSELFTRKRPHVSQCYANARQNGKIDDKARGYVALALTVLPSGQPENVRVSKSTLNAPAVEECVVALVAKWVLPQPSQAIEFSFTYDFKPE